MNGLISASAVFLSLNMIMLSEGVIMLRKQRNDVSYLCGWVTVVFAAIGMWLNVVSWVTERFL